MKTFEMGIGMPMTGAKILKEIEKTVAKQASKKVRKQIIDSAYLIRDTVADNAPNKTYKEILLGSPLERYYNYNSGFDVRLDRGMQARFVLKLSTDRFARGTYLGYNPIWGLIASNKGRDEKYIGKGKVPVPMDKPKNPKAKRPWNHPELGYGHKARYKERKVGFIDSIPGVKGTHWIEAGVLSASSKAANILGGRGTYTKRKTTETFWE